MKIKNRKKNKGGFTLVELMVATFIFMTIMLASMGALLVTMDGARNARGLRTAMDNVNFAMESMTRSIRMGTNYYCVETGDGIGMSSNLEASNDCVGGGTFVAFIPQKNIASRVGYRLHTDTNISTLQRCDINGCVPIVAPEVYIEKLNFVVRGSGPDDNIQASVYIIIKGTITIKGIPTSFAIQTMASQRNF